MQTKYILFVLALAVGFAAAYWLTMGIGADPAASHNLAQLSDNPQNQRLQLRANPQPDFVKICEQYTKMSREEIAHQLRQPNRELNEVAFGLHYLGNRYLAADSFETGVAYLRASAENYLNAFSYLKLAQIYATPTEEVLQKYAPRPLKYAQDLPAAFRYLQFANVLAETSMQKQGDGYVFQQLNRYFDGTLSRIKEAMKAQNIELSKEELNAVQLKIDSLRTQYELMYTTAAKVSS